MRFFGLILIVALSPFAMLYSAFAEEACSQGYAALNKKEKATARNPFFDVGAELVSLADRQWFALDAIVKDPAVTGKLRQAVSDKLSYFAKPTSSLAGLETLSAEARSMNAAEFCLDSFIDPNEDSNFRELIFSFLKNSPSSDGETIKYLTKYAAGAVYTTNADLRDANEAIRGISSRIGSYPPRTASAMPRTDMSDILLHEPIASVKSLGGGQNVSLMVRFANGKRAVFKPRIGEVEYASGNPNYVDFTREATSYTLIDNFLGNKASIASGKSAVFVTKSEAVALVHGGEAYGMGSIQAFADGYFDIQKISTDPVYAKVWQALQSKPQWQLLVNRIRTIDFILGNFDRLPLAINGRSYPKNLMIKVPGLDFSEPTKLEAQLSAVDWNKLQVTLIDNGLGRNPLGSFTIQDLGNFPLRADIPEDLQKAILHFDEAAFRKEMKDRLPDSGIDDVINRIHLAQDRIHHGP